MCGWFIWQFLSWSLHGDDGVCGDVGSVEENNDDSCPRMLPRKSYDQELVWQPSTVETIEDNLSLNGDMLCYKSKVQSMQNIVSEHEQYLDALRDFNDWLISAKEELQRWSDLSGDSVSIKRKLSKVQVRHFKFYCLYKMIHVAPFFIFTLVSSFILLLSFAGSHLNCVWNLFNMQRQIEHTQSFLPPVTSL